MGKLRRKLSFANLTSLLALFVALATGGAYAADQLLEKNDVKSKHIKDGGVKTKDIADNAVTSPKVLNGSLLGEDFAGGQLPQGPEGPQGPQGVPGTTGDTGPQGPSGPGRSSDMNASCDPGAATIYVTCVSVELTLPSPGRVLLVADGLWQQQTGTPSGRCRFSGNGTSNEQFDFGNGPVSGSLGLNEVTGSVPAGTHEWRIECREFVGNTFSFTDMQISAVYVGNS